MVSADRMKRAAEAAVSGGLEEGDAVNNPTHYNQHGIEAIAAIEASMSYDEFTGYLKGNALKYLWRYQYKGKPVEDLQKAQWYLDLLLMKAKAREDE